MPGVCRRVSASATGLCPLTSPDNHLLEKAELLAKFSEKLKSEPEDVTSAPHQDCW